jgi:hypothetical protein
MIFPGFEEAKDGKDTHGREEYALDLVGDCLELGGPVCPKPYWPCADAFGLWLYGIEGEITFMGEYRREAADSSPERYWEDPRWCCEGLAEGYFVRL